MKITLLTYGSRGDVQPFVALARALIGRGHAVRLAGPHRFAGLAEEHAVPFTSLAGDPEEISRRINDAGANTLQMIRGMQEYVMSIAGEVARSAFSACADADLILHSFLFTTGAHSLARQMGIPDISAQLFPVFLPTTEFPNVAMPAVPAGPLSYLTHWMANLIFWYGGNSSYKRLSRMNPRSFPRRLYWPFKDSGAKSRTPLLGAWSPRVLPLPHDWPADSAYISGYWFLDPPGSYDPPAELADFLAAGSKPVCVTFGSMIHPRAGQTAREVMRAIAAAGERAVVLTGWQEWKTEAHENALFLKDAPHTWLFPRCTAVVHHGGAGTTAAGLRAGVPNIVVPFAADQLFWAKRVHALGLIRKPVRVEKLTAGWLRSGLEEARGEERLRRARALGEQIEGEDGVSGAVRFIEEQAGKG